MAIYRILQNSPLDPDQISVLSEAYEMTLRSLSLVDRDDTVTEIIARKIISIAQSGVRKATDISALAIKELGVQ